MSEVKVYTANVFMPGCLGPIKGEVVFEEDHSEAMAKAYTAVDMATAAAEGFRDGQKSVVCPICSQRAAVQAHIDAAEG